MGRFINQGRPQPAAPATLAPRPFAHAMGYYDADEQGRGPTIVRIPRRRRPMLTKDKALDAIREVMDGLRTTDERVDLANALQKIVCILEDTP